MARIISIDYGQKRCGIAVSDISGKFSFALETVSSAKIFDFLEDYFNNNDVSTIVIGLPLNLKNQMSDSARYTEPFVLKLKKLYPDKKIERIDERFTSKMASQTILDSGAKKKQRQDKSLVDSVSAAIILQSYLLQLENKITNEKSID